MTVSTASAQVVAYDLLARALVLTDAESRRHCWRVTRLAVKVAGLAGWEHAAGCLDAQAGYYLHDVGKLAVPDVVRAKTDALTPLERMAFERHPVHGSQLVEGLTDACRCVLHVVRGHHERWDGSGYPDGRSGDDIPEAARVFAVADALDAMSSDHPYRPARSRTEIEGELRDGAGHQFDPRLIAAVADRLDDLWPEAPAGAPGWSGTPWWDGVAL